MKSILLFFLSIFLSNICFGQTFNYSYDNSGNRVSRKLIISKSLIENNDSSITNNDRIIEPIDDKTILVYPNPTSEEVNIEISGYTDPINGSMFLIDQGGRMIMDRPINSTRNTYNLSRYSKGVYFLVIRIGTFQTKYTIIKN
jgi:hypothetical protein